jgi:hypothetical protein
MLRLGQPTDEETALRRPGTGWTKHTTQKSVIAGPASGRLADREGGDPMTDVKMWGDKPYYGLGYEFDPQWLLTPSRSKSRRG